MNPVALVVVVLMGLPLPRSQADGTICRADGGLVRLPDLPEASGLAFSRSVPGRLWSHNDSGAPVLFALDVKGTVTARVRVTGATVDDWEAVAAGPCPAGSCLYLGDIGDNDGVRRQITVYRLPEPSGREPTVAVTDVFHGRFPDGPQDAEALLAAPDGGLYIVTKGIKRPAAVYRFPRHLQSGAVATLERVGSPRTPDSKKDKDEERITDGSISPDGRSIVLRTGRTLLFHPAAQLTAGDWRGEQVADLGTLGEPQGEGVAYGPDGAVYLVGEGGGDARPGTFARLSCSTR